MDKLVSVQNFHKSSTGGNICLAVCVGTVISVPGSVGLHLVQSRNNQQQLVGFQEHARTSAFFFFSLGDIFKKVLRRWLES